jgi:isopentenyl-diphosphate Delta-isomerase
MDNLEEKKVVLVDENDNEIGTENKMKAHQEGGKLHRAFSVFIFNSKGEALIQRRAHDKYHCPGLWTNTCCSHPSPGESTEKAASRRLNEEMGFSCDVKKIFSKKYSLKLDNDLWEKEFDHIFIGEYEGEIKINPEEVSEWKWVSIEKLKEDIENNPDNYTPWFRLLLNDLIIKIS